MVAIGAFLVVWEALPRLGLIDTFLLPPVSVVLKKLFSLAFSGDLNGHLMSSLRRSLSGFGLSIAIGIPLGVCMGWFKRFEKLVDPLLQVFRNTSILALFPVFILIFGLGEVSKVAIIFWGTIWPTLLNTISGVKSTDPLLVKSARSMGVSQIVLFWKVVIPAALPSILTGIRLSAANAVLILVAAEMLGANSGLGFFIFYSEQAYAIPEMYAGIVAISILGCMVNYTLIGFERRLTGWKERANRPKLKKKERLYETFVDLDRGFNSPDIVHCWRPGSRQSGAETGCGQTAGLLCSHIGPFTVCGR